jgi:hypothetical protein
MESARKLSDGVAAINHLTRCIQPLLTARLNIPTDANHVISDIRGCGGSLTKAQLIQLKIDHVHLGTNLVRTAKYTSGSNRSRHNLCNWSASVNSRLCDMIYVRKCELLIDQICCIEGNL